MPVELVYETHATSVDNERGIATGWLDGELSARGREQAVELGRRRRDDGVSAVYASDLGRAVETAGLAFAGTNIPVRQDRRLRECDYGELNGAPVAEVAAVRRRHLDEPFPGGESCRQVVERVPRQVAVQVCRMVREEQVRQVPVTVCRMVEEQRVEPYEVRVCKWVCEKQTIQVPRVVTREVPVTYTSRVPRTIVTHVPVDACDGG